MDPGGQYSLMVRIVTLRRPSFLFYRQTYVKCVVQIEVSAM